MTSYDLKRVIGEELARVENRFDKFGKPERKTVFDKVVPGFGVRKHASGRKVYILQMRISGRQRTVTIANAAVISETVAKDVARRLILRIELGMNPADEKKRSHDMPSYQQFLEYYWETSSPNWKPSTRKTQSFYRGKHLNKAFESKFLDEIEPADAIRWHAQLSRAAGPGAANRASEILRAMFNKAEQWGYLPENSNPFNAIRRNRGRKIERFLTPEEAARLGKALIEARKDEPMIATIIMLLALTGCRRGEIVNLKWSEVHGRRLKLKDSKTGPRIVWLGKDAQALIASIPRQKGEARVFPMEQKRPGGAVGCFWANFREEIGLKDVRLHDLRHNYASFAARGSETLPMIGKLLGHAAINSTQRYAHLDDATLLEASNRIGDVVGNNLFH
ncbi:MULTISPECIES: tyrosine-type recombinase/integrase [Parasphingorhabdus]|jgi:integrase|uniref:Tyrosine-type recombinase/integrase n=1 Tax=Parasphingorhabdus halotolerans TaxID=2725558 RepID=A0A6H2DQQ6_9SPHN|nr:tyrosine-type recombinase/integrase [Parasphingorhabdus halotolerans]QJB70313.1 tyrosine-type recombinase/integrase [Parasphingorhabdus halotolerans]